MSPTPADSQRAVVLAIDLGSSGVKVGLIDADGRLLASTSERYGIQLFEGGGAEHDANDWWAAIVTCVRRLMTETQVPAARVKAIGCTSCWSVTVPVDTRGLPVGPAISWMDTRGGRHNREMMKGFPSVAGYGAFKLLRWIQATGGAPTQSGVDSLAHMLFLKHERRDVYARAHKLLEPMDAITFRLSGRATSTRSTQFPTVMLDVASTGAGRYHPYALALSGIDEGKLGELVDVDARVGTLAPDAATELGLSSETAVLAGVPDNHTSAIGAGAVQHFEAVAVLGTSGFLGAHLPVRGLDLDTFITTMPSPMPGRHLIFGDLGNNGKVLDSWLDRHVYADDELLKAHKPDDVYARLDQLVQGVPTGSEGVLFLPWFNGTLCPREDGAMRGGFLNVSHRTTRAHFARAVLEGICLNWRWLLGAAERFAKHRFPMLRLAGGGARSTQWAQLMADVTGRPVHQQADPTNGNVLGMGFLLLRHLGLLDLDTVAAKLPAPKVFTPNPKHAALFDERFKHFLLAEKQLRPLFHQMNPR